MVSVTAVHAGRSLEISNLVDIGSEVNRELAMRLVTDVASGNQFQSDLNGFQVRSHCFANPSNAGGGRRGSFVVPLQMQQRRTLSKLPLQANFYPMTSAAFLQDASSRLTLLSAQSQGVASLKPGDFLALRSRSGTPAASVGAAALTHLGFSLV